jgi:hypothetical protein
MSENEKPPSVPLVSEVTLEFGDGIYTFKLSLRWIDAIQKDLGVGLGTIGRLTMGSEWNAMHVYKLIYYGLVGGGLPAVNARQLCERYLDGLPLARSDDPSSPLNVARSIIGATWFGVPEDLTGKTQATATMEAGSMSPDITGKPSPATSQSQPLPSYLLANS